MKIFSIEGGLYNFLDKFSNFFLLNLLWLIMCIPIITIFPATIAMFGVVRKWIKGEHVKLFNCFFTLFKENFIQSLLIGVIAFIFTLLLILNFNITSLMDNPFKVITLSLLSLIGFLSLCTSVYIFPVIVNYNVKWTAVIRNSFLLSVSQPFVTLPSILILLISMVIVYTVPITLFIVGSLSAYLIYFLCNKTFQKVEAQFNQFKKEGQSA
ncbi:putative membrane protein YesL [Scopulibacillus darangshiensis]|uniref:Putative membrane protein YesL n=1 Tax=Scopulibacillus darangshiensis TaxID=442528 RepID=A0A4R2PBP7_9BACL|nr:DUF624 domain-containing protein [Scopulibacillus darangshiensis]TCP31335.1 putative membrane protein YesL [Scopulibacillus darangshiensis]